jgi:hypothetical protein
VSLRSESAEISSTWPLQTDPRPRGTGGPQRRTSTGRSAIGLSSDTSTWLRSMMWRRRPQLVDGLVMCVTSRNFCDSPTRRAFFTLVDGSADVHGIDNREPLAGFRRQRGRGDCNGAVAQLESLNRALVMTGRGYSKPARRSARSTRGRGPTRSTFSPVQRCTVCLTARPPAPETAGRFTSELLMACRSVAS